ncbi:protein Atg16l2-like isoform X2 [Syngnathus typhle]|uniref:protein Atg16l2-like isoform X2 n=1 Tax=Syngnathus typhle TaxID=161592 RepID=UPI002A69E7A5|nr:protein Atg16l2-like isoform X2 [Syngnathus typhle]
MKDTPADGELWKAHVVQQLRRRDREQHHTFRDLVCAYSRLLDRGGASDWLSAASCGAVVWAARARRVQQLHKAAGELACQVVEKQQQMTIKDSLLDGQRDRLLQGERGLAGARQLRQQLCLRAQRLEVDNRLLKSKYDALMERQRRAERRLREEKLRGSGLLEDVMGLKRQAAARLNRRNDRRSRVQDASLEKDLQTAASSMVKADGWACLAPGKKLAEKGQERLLRSAPASRNSLRIPASIRELFERRRGQSECAPEEQEEPARPVGVPASARLPGRALHVLEAHEQGVNTAAFCSSSALLASAGTDRVVKVWEVRAGTLRHRTTLDGSTEGLTCVQFDPTGHRILAGSYDKSALLWCLDHPVAKLTLTGHSRKVTAARFSGHQVVTGSADGTVRIWDLQRAACVHLARVASFCSDVVCSENVAISGHFDHKIRLWDTSVIECVTEGRGRVVWLQAVQLRPLPVGAGQSDIFGPQRRRPAPAQLLPGRRTAAVGRPQLEPRWRLLQSGRLQMCKRQHQSGHQPRRSLRGGGIGRRRRLHLERLRWKPGDAPG